MPETAAKEELENEELENEELENEGNEEPDEETVSMAKSMGWVDSDKFRGDKDRWVGADEFVEKGLNDLPILRERLRSQSKKITDMETDISSFKTYHEETLSKEYSRAIHDIREKQLATVEEGDTEAYQKLEKQKEQLAISHSRNRPPASPPADNPLYSSWKDKNSEWFEKDADMTSYANRMSDYIAETKPELIGKQEFLDEIEKEVKSRYQNKFENPNRDKPNAVEGGGRQHRSKGSHTYSDLPGEAKAACDRFVRRGQISRKQYLETYEWD